MGQAEHLQLPLPRVDGCAQPGRAQGHLTLESVPWGSRQKRTEIWGREGML